jgi:hypothetical protein
VRRILLAMLLAVALGLPCARVAAAAEGGPAVAEVIGWDAKLKRVYVQLVHVEESEYSPALWYFDLRSARPAVPQFVDWTGAEQDDVYERRFARLRRHLHGLQPVERSQSVLDFGAGPGAPRDSVDADGGRLARYVSRVRPAPGGADSLRVLTLDPGRHAVRRLREYALPGSGARLAILSCDAMRVESGYEVQFPVLFGAGPGTADPLDPEAFDVRH